MPLVSDNKRESEQAVVDPVGARQGPGIHCSAPETRGVDGRVLVTRRECVQILPRGEVWPPARRTPIQASGFTVIYRESGVSSRGEVPQSVSTQRQLRAIWHSPR